MELQTTQFNPFNIFKDLLWITTTICPSCKQIQKTYDEAKFVKEIGECGQCDHNRYSILEVSNLEEMEE